MSIRRIITIASTLIVIVVVLSVAGSSLKTRSEAVNCRKTMSSIGIAARLWANDNSQEVFPDSLVLLSNEIGATRILICPGDHSRQPPSSWAMLTPDHSSYEIVTPNLQSSNASNAFLRCKIHGHLAYTDSRIIAGVAPQ